MKKIVFVFVAIVLLAAMIVVPVSAADSGWSTISVRFDNNLYISESASGLYYNYFYTGTNTGDHYAYQLNLGAENITAASRLTGAEFSLQQGDVVTIPDISSSFTGWLGGSENKITGYRWAVCYFDDTNNQKLPYTCFMATGWRDFKGLLFGDDYTTSDTFIKGGTNWGIASLKGTTLTAPKAYTRCSVLLLLKFELTEEAVFSMNNRDFSISFGNPNSPYAPNFQSPDTEQVDEYTELEGEVLDSISGGLTDVEGSFTDIESHFLRLGAALTGANKIFDIAFSEITFWTPLLYISLALGFAAFILSIAPAGARLLSRDDYKKADKSDSGGVNRLDSVGR